MPHLARSVATLRLAGDELDPEEISRLLGTEPDAAQRKGEELRGKRGIRVAKSGLWRLSATPAEPEGLDSQVEELLGKLSQDLDVWRNLSSRFRVDLFCGWFMKQGNEGVCISPATLHALGSRGIELGVDIYAPDTDA
jgi:hypothetical protein